MATTGIGITELYAIFGSIFGAGLFFLVFLIVVSAIFGAGNRLVDWMR